MSPQFAFVAGEKHGPVAVSQHPSGQLVALQTHWPLALQTVPAGQVTQMTPLSPQFSLVFPGVMQGPLAVSQQPLGQVVALHPTQTPCALQVCPSGQVTQITPLKPQFAVVGGVMHGPAAVSQQPLGQLVALQTHWPVVLLQTSPDGQVPQEPSQPSGPHSLPWQAGWQTQSPLTHCSCPVQVSQISPPVPQFSLVLPGVMHGPAAVSQQPLGQLVALQTHWPVVLLQTSPDGQVPQEPSQPSGPHSLPWQFGVQHCPFSSQVVVPAGQQTGAPAAFRQQIVAQVPGSGWPKTGVYTHVLFGPVQAPFWHTSSAQAPQLTVCPQLLVTLPHLGEGVPTPQV